MGRTRRRQQPRSPAGGLERGATARSGWKGAGRRVQYTPVPRIQREGGWGTPRTLDLETNTKPLPGARAAGPPGPEGPTAAGDPQPRADVPYVRRVAGRNQLGCGTVAHRGRARRGRGAPTPETVGLWTPAAGRRRSRHQRVVRLGQATRRRAGAPSAFPLPAPASVAVRKSAPPPPSQVHHWAHPAAAHSAVQPQSSGSRPRDATAADTPCSHARGHAGASRGSPPARAHPFCPRAGASASARPPVPDEFQSGAVKKASRPPRRFLRKPAACQCIADPRIWSWGTETETDC